MGPKDYHIGIDWGLGPSQTVHFYVDPQTGRAVQLTQKQYDDQLREDWGKNLMVDFKAATTRGAEQRGWLKAQLYLRTGREVRIQWRKTTSR